MKMDRTKLEIPLAISAGVSGAFAFMVLLGFWLAWAGDPASVSWAKGLRYFVPPVVVFVICLSQMWTKA